MARPSATSNYAQAGIAAARENERLLQAALENSPDYSKIVQKAHVRQGKENIAAMKAESKVSQAAINQYAATATKKTLMDAEDNYKGEVRKAGILAGAGKLVGTGLLGLGQEKSKKRVVGEGLEFYDKQIERARDAISESDQAIADFRNNPNRFSSQPSSTESSGTSNFSDTSDTDSGSGSTGIKPVSPDISANHSAGPGKLSKDAIKSYAVQAGFSPEEALTVVGIAGGESGYDPTNSTKRSGLYAKTGEDSVGLMQINWGYHKDRGWLQDLGITKREQLLDPVTNMKAAKYLYDGRGNFGDWTVYNKGIYKDYL